MRKILTLALLGLTAMAVTGCAGTFQRSAQQIQREMNGGYPAVIKLYSLDGKLLQTWQGSLVLPVSDDDGDPSLTFISDGKKVSVSGVYSIEEK